jgi:hypothetical protein
MKKSASREHAALLRWLEDGAPAGRDQPSPRPSPIPRRLGKDDGAGGTSSEDAALPRSRRSTAGKGATAELEKILARGVASLPLDAKQRARAKELARDAIALFGTRARPTRMVEDGGGAKLKIAPTLQSLAAAIAYAIVYVDHVPLTQAEVAACFRVSVASLRGRFGEIRSHLDLTPGDARYATVRRR